MLENAVSLAWATALVANILYAIEQLLVYERFVAARVDVALIDDVAEIVDVGEHTVELFEVDGPFRQFAAGAAGETHVCHRGLEAFEGVIACGV
nr:hypothetical protein [Nocardia wallacei]